MTADRRNPMSPSDDWEQEMARLLTPLPADDPARDRRDVVASVIAENYDVAAELDSFLRDLQSLATRPAPAPTAALEEVFASTAFAKRVDEIHARRAHRRRRRIAVTAAAICVTSIGLTGVAAATDTLPSGAQQVVSRVIDNVTPFHVNDGARPPVGAPPGQPAPIPVPAAGSTQSGSKSAATGGTSGHGNGNGNTHGGTPSHPTPTQSPAHGAGNGNGGPGSGFGGGFGGSGGSTGRSEHPPTSGSSEGRHGGNRGPGGH